MKNKEGYKSFPTDDALSGLIRNCCERERTEVGRNATIQLIASCTGQFLNSSVNQSHTSRKVKYHIYKFQESHPSNIQFHITKIVTPISLFFSTGSIGHVFSPPPFGKECITKTWGSWFKFLNSQQNAVTGDLVELYTESTASTCCLARYFSLRSFWK